MTKGKAKDKTRPRSKTVETIGPVKMITYSTDHWKGNKYAGNTSIVSIVPVGMDEMTAQIVTLLDIAKGNPIWKTKEGRQCWHCTATAPLGKKPFVHDNDCVYLKAVAVSEMVEQEAAKDDPTSD